MAALPQAETPLRSTPEPSAPRIEDTGATQIASSIPATANETVEVVVRPERLGADRLFVRIVARSL